MVTWWLKGQAQRRDSLTGMSVNYQSQKSQTRPQSFMRLSSNESESTLKTTRFSPNIMPQKTTNVSTTSKLSLHDSEISSKSPPHFASLNTSDLKKNKLLSFIPSQDGGDSRPSSGEVTDSHLALPGYAVVELH